MSTIPVVGSCVLFCNTDKGDDERNGWTAKVIDEYRDETGARMWHVRWYNGLEERGIDPSMCVHV